MRLAWTLPSLEVVVSVMLCPDGSGYCHTNDVGLGKEKWVPSKVVP